MIRQSNQWAFRYVLNKFEPWKKMNLNVYISLIFREKDKLTSIVILDTFFSLALLRSFGFVESKKLDIVKLKENLSSTESNLVYDDKVAELSGWAPKFIRKNDFERIPK